MLKLTESYHDYESKKEYVRASEVKEFTTPKQFVWNRLHPMEDKPELAWGRAFHTLFAQPELFQGEFMVLTKNLLPVPDKDFRTKANMDYKKAFYDKAKELKKTVLENIFDNPEDDRVQGLFTMRDNVNKLYINIKEGGHIKEQILFKELMDTGEFEQSFYYTEPETGLKIKMRPDWFSIDNRMIIDFKTAKDASPIGFKKDMFNLRYPLKEVLYMDAVSAITGEKINQVWYAAVEKTQPYLASLHLLSEDIITWARQQYRKNILAIADILNKGITFENAAGYDYYDKEENGFFMVNLPKYLYDEIEY